MTSVVFVDKSKLTSPVDKVKVEEQEGSNKAGRKIQCKALYKVWEWSRQGTASQVATQEGGRLLKKILMLKKLAEKCTDCGLVM